MSFYASVECVERGLNPMKTNLVVADKERTEKTICLAVSPSLKAYGISGRARLFEVVQSVKKVNEERRYCAPHHKLTGSSWDAEKISQSPELAVDYLVAPPQMAHYMEWSTKIYHIYLNYISPDDIHVYSVDEVLMDVTNYLGTYHLSSRELASKIIQDIFEQTGITATAGIADNLYLCKIALDIQAKHTQPDEHGIRIAELDEMSYRRLLWSHRPLTDFWRIGRGYEKKLAQYGIYTMGDIARCSIGKRHDFWNEALLYKLFGINAELLIDHAWGWEPCTIADIKAYKPSTKSLTSGQVLQCPYDAAQTKAVVKEMIDMLVLDLVGKKLVTNQITLTIGYDIENLKNPDIKKSYNGEITTDHYGRMVPKHAHGSVNLEQYTSSSKVMIQAAMELYEQIINQKLLVRRINMSVNRLVDEAEARKEEETYEQLSLFTDYGNDQATQVDQKELEREKKIQEAMLQIKQKYGKNAVLKGMNLVEGATAVERNKQIGGHKA